MIFVILPAYNEEKTIPPLYRSLEKFFAAQRLSYIVVIVNDGSTDKTKQVVLAIKKRSCILINHVKNKGLGEAMKTGILYALNTASPNDIVITMDADNTHSPTMIRDMLTLLDQGYDFVTASRFASHAEMVGVPWNRRSLGVVGSYLFRLVFPIKGIKEYTCAYRAYRARLLQKAHTYYGDTFISETGFSSTADMVLKLRRFIHRAGEVPLVLRYDLKEGASKMNVKKNIVDTVWLIIKRRFDKKIVGS